MSNNQLIATIQSQDQEIARLRNTLQQRNNLNYEEKYKKALKSIEEIIRANKQIKDELDNLRIMRQTDLQSFTNIQKEQFKKAYDALLKDKNSLVISLQSLQLQNEKLKYNISELQNQISLYRNEKQFRFHQERETVITNTHPEIHITSQNSPRKSDNNKDYSSLIREKEAEFHKTIQNYEEHHSNMVKTTKRLQQRIGQLENKLISSEKNWRVKLQTKELQVIDIKALTRQQFTEQINILRKENSNLRIVNNDLAIKLQTNDKNMQFQNNLQNYDWEAEIVQEMINVKANLQPLRQQINELTEINLYDKEESIRQRTSLHTRVLELQSQVERQKQTIKTYERTIFENHQTNRTFEQKINNVKRLQQQNQLLHGKVIVMESRQIALRNRSGEELQQRVLEFQSRIELLLNNKQGLKELREIGIHQLLALKAYIMQLDGKLKELMNSNAYLLKKYKSYKEKYQSSLKQHKQYGMTINSLKMKILGYDKLVLKLQGELQRFIKMNESQMNQSNRVVIKDDSSNVYRHKYELMKEKLEIQTKYKEQEIQTLKLNYETKIVQLTIKIQDIRTYKETIELYKHKNQELQHLVSRKQSQIFQSKILTSSKVGNVQSEQHNPKQTKEIINNLHANLKQSDETIFKLQSELRIKQDTYKRSTLKLERQISDLKEEHQKTQNKKEMDYTINMDQEIKKYKLKISDLEHNLHLSTISYQEGHHKNSQENDSKYRKLESRFHEAQSKREEEVFAKRRLQKQIIELTQDKEELQRFNNELQIKITQSKQLQRQNQGLKSKIIFNSKNEQKNSIIDYELQSKESIIKKLNHEILQLKSNLAVIGQKDITISSLKNEMHYYKKEIEQLNETISKYNTQIIFLKNTLDSNKVSYNSGFENLLQQKEAISSKIRKELFVKEARIIQMEQQRQVMQGKIRKLSRQVDEMKDLRYKNESLQSLMLERDRAVDRIKSENNQILSEIDRVNEQLNYVKQSYQKQSYDILEREDEISKLRLQLSMISLRNKEQYENRLTEQLIEKERQFSKLNSEFSSVKNQFSHFDQQKKYLEDNITKLNSQVYNYKGQINELNDENQRLRDESYYKQQEYSKVTYSIQTYQSQIEEYQFKEQQIYRVRGQITTLKNTINNLQEEVFNKEVVNARLSNDNNNLRCQVDDRAQDIALKQQQINRLTYELNQLRSGHSETELSYQEQKYSLEKASSELSSLKNKYRNLEEQMEERENAFSMLNQELSKFKSSLSYYEEEIEHKEAVITRFNTDREHLQSEIFGLQEEISMKTQEANRLKQQIFGIKMQSSQRDYQQNMRVQQEMFRYKNRISSLENELEDKQSDIRRLNIEIQSMKSIPAPSPMVSEEEIFQLHNELNRKQRDLVNMKFQSEDKDYQIESLTNNLNLLKKSLNDYQLRLQSEREQFQLSERKTSSRERQLQDQIYRLTYQVQSKIHYIEPKPIQPIYDNQQQVRELQGQLTSTRRQMSNLKFEVEDKLFIIEGLNSKIRSLENTIVQLQSHSHQGNSHYELQVQQLLRKDRQKNNEIRQRQEDISNLEQQLKMVQSQYKHQIATYTQEISRYEQQITLLNHRINSKTTDITSADAKANLYASNMSERYIEEIDRLNGIISDLQKEINDFKLKLSSMINQENRIQENLVTMMLLFTQVQALRERIKSKEKQINSVRRSFIQMAVSGEMEANQMSRIMALNQQSMANSIERIQTQSQNGKSKERIAPFQRIVQAHERLQKSREPRTVQNVSVNRQQHTYIQRTSDRQEIIAHHTLQNKADSVSNSQESYSQSGEGEGERLVTKGSLIEDLQREQSMDGSQYKGQITIKIPNAGQLAGQSYTQQINRQQVVHQGQYQGSQINQIHQIHQINQQVPLNIQRHSMQSHMVIQGNPLPQHQQQQRVTINNHQVYAHPQQVISINQPMRQLIIHNQPSFPYSAVPQ